MQPTDPNKELQRKILQGHVAAYLKAGGKIHVIESGFAMINANAAPGWVSDKRKRE